MKLLRVAAIVAALTATAVTTTVMAQGIGTAGYEMKYGDEYMGAREYGKAAMRLQRLQHHRLHDGLRAAKPVLHRTQQLLRA